MPDLLHTLTERGLLHDATPNLGERLAKGPITAYVGFDPTADSLHVGNLVPLMAMAWVQRAGGRPILLVGGGTGLVGDPSGRRAERPMLSLEEIDANAEAVRRQLARFLSFEGPNAASLSNNADWLRPLTMLEFLRDTGKHFTVNYMLQKESVQSRKDTGISFTEFAYMLVMAYDYHHLFRTQRCELQLGGSDQWGNITAGIELIARREQAQTHGLVSPLLTTAAGTKFGKSEEGNIWLDPAKTSPYKFYQFWLNTDDRDVERLLKIFTFRPMEEIAETMAQHAASPQKRDAQRTLAIELTLRVHGEAVLGGVLQASDILFGAAEIGTADVRALETVANEVRVAPIARAEIETGYPVVDALVGAGLASSKADARRSIQGNGYRINGEKLTAERSLGPFDLLANRFIVLQKGKKHFAMIDVG